MNVYDLIRLSGIIINGLYLYYNSNELYEINIYNIFLMWGIYNLIKYGVSCIFFILCSSYLPNILSTNIKKVLKYKFLENDRNKETDIKNTIINGIFSTGVCCVFILTNTALFPKWLHFMCTPLLSTIIAIIYIIIKYNLDIFNIIINLAIRYTLYSLSSNLPNLIIMTLMNYFIPIIIKKIPSLYIEKTLIFILTNI